MRTIKMKAATATITVFLMGALLGVNAAKAQSENKQIVVYSVFANVVNSDFPAPLIGFINVAQGKQFLPQIGFINVNQARFTSAQAGFINVIGGSLKGVQAGFGNAVAQSTNGLQAGFFNATGGENTTGAQIGFVNAAKQVNGAQIGFLNVAPKISGAQISFLNVAANQVNGAQIGFLNITKKINGIQIGFLNFADTVENGLPIGFLSLVKKGNYQAVEIGASNIAPINVAYKIGLSKLYTSFMVAYVPDDVAAGIGFGSILPISGKFFFNPEINSLTTVNKYPQQYVSLLPRFGVKLNNRLSIVAAPTGTFTHTDKEHNLKSPLFQFRLHDVNDYQQFFWGGYAGITMQL